MRLLWIRHGARVLPPRAETPPERILTLFNHHEDAPLAEAGQAQAASVAQHLSRRPLDAIYTSPMVRARQTAQPTAEETGLPVVQTADIAELQPGWLPLALVRYLHARTAPDRSVIRGPIVPAFFFGWWFAVTRNGEPRRGYWGRLRRFLNRLRRDHPPDAQIAIFSHGYLIFTLGALCVRPWRRRWLAWRQTHIPNGAICTFELHTDGRLELIGWAEDAHLR